MCVSGVSKPIGWFGCSQAKAIRIDLGGILQGQSKQQESCQAADGSDSHFPLALSEIVVPRLAPITIVLANSYLQLVAGVFFTHPY